MSKSATCFGRLRGQFSKYIHQGKEGEKLPLCFEKYLIFITLPKVAFTI
jgi:hypothetical protein